MVFLVKDTDDEQTAVSAHKSKATDAAVAKPPATKEDKPKLPKLGTLVTTSEEGLSVAQKLFFVGAIVAVCALYLRSRGAKSGTTASGFKEKSMA